MSAPDDNGRSSPARGYALAMQASSIAIQMVTPAALGYWADSAWGTRPWLLIVGVFLGFGVALLEIVDLAKRSGRRR